MREFICIVCPNGCRLKVDENKNGSLNISGNTCKRGETFAQNEMLNPMRTLTSTVKTSFEQWPALPVRTDGEIPKEKVMLAMQELKKIVVNRALKCNDIIIQNFLDTGVNLIATFSIG